MRRFTLRLENIKRLTPYDVVIPSEKEVAELGAAEAELKVATLKNQDIEKRWECVKDQRKAVENCNTWINGVLVRIQDRQEEIRRLTQELENLKNARSEMALLLLAAERAAESEIKIDLAPLQARVDFARKKACGVLVLNVDPILEDRPITIGGGGTNV
jgi:hypothetical protein